MKAYFTEGYNLADFDTLVKLVKEVGLDDVEARKVLENNEFSEQVIKEQQEARQIGVQGVPFFVINRKYGVSGAQQEEYFTAALEQIWQEENPLVTLDDADEESACTDESCSL